MSQPVPVSTMAAAGSPGAVPILSVLGQIDMPYWAGAATLVYMTLLTAFLLWDRCIKPRLHKRELARIADAARERGGRGARG